MLWLIPLLASIADARHTHTHTPDLHLRLHLTGRGVFVDEFGPFFLFFISPSSAEFKYSAYCCYIRHLHFSPLLSLSLSLPHPPSLFLFSYRIPFDLSTLRSCLDCDNKICGVRITVRFYLLRILSNARRPGLRTLGAAVSCEHATHFPSQRYDFP